MRSVAVLFVAVSVVNALLSNVDLFNSDVDCYNDYAFEGSFEFLNSRARAYWHLESDNVYFEYYFPASYWIGIAASNQRINNLYNHCFDCYRQNRDISHCLAQCVGNNMFVATTQGDNDPELSWNILEFQAQTHNGQYQIASRLHSVWGIKGRENASFQLETLSIDGTEYIHGSWRRELKLSAQSEWIEPINDFDSICWTTISSAEHNSNARASELGYFIDIDSAEMHCDIGRKKVCSDNAAKREDTMPDLGTVMTALSTSNVSLIILMDSSMSVTAYFDALKSYIAHLFEKMQNKHLRTALILFDHKVRLIWNLDFFDSFDYEKAKSMISQAMHENERQRLSGTHIRDVLQYTVETVFPLLNPWESNIVLLLSDGKPSSCAADIDQSPCQLSPNPISKSFKDNQVQLKVIAVGDLVSKEEKYESKTRIGATFECLFENVQRMQDSIIIGKSGKEEVIIVKEEVIIVKEEVIVTDKNECQSPKYFPSPLEWDKCEEESMEWKVDFKNWFYNVYEDKTYVLYEACVLVIPPFSESQTCKAGKESKAMSMVLFQIPCFCEVCINSMTESMSPRNGYTTEVHQGWLWEYVLYPGQCSNFEIVLDGYVAMDKGYYKIHGDGHRWVEGSIRVPNPCYPSIGYPMHYESETESETAKTTTKLCSYDSPLYPEHECSYVCDNYFDNEWRAHYVHKYNQDGNTVFVYNAFVESDITHLECTKKEHNSAQTLSKVFLRLGCECEYQSQSFLESITVGMHPFGDIKDNYWRWTLDLQNGDIQELRLILKGEDMEMGSSDVTLVGADRRCTANTMIQVPNPCKNHCLFGEWTKWSSFGECSQECGGGYKYKTRQCVSICDGLTKIDNCYGENNHMSPCNTNPCV